MTDTPTNRIHYILYPVLGAALLGALWLWHDTQITGLKQALLDAKTAQAAQVVTDKQATTAIAIAQATLQTKSVQLTKQLNAATTPVKQAALLNQYLGTHVEIQPQATNPSVQIAEVPVTELPLLTRDVIQYQEMQNQVEADKVVIAAKTEQITARDNTISTQNVEITKLKGGSHFRRFLQGAKQVGIGIAIGVVIDRTIQHK